MVAGAEKRKSHDPIAPKTRKSNVLAQEAGFVFGGAAQIARRSAAKPQNGTWLHLGSIGRLIGLEIIVLDKLGDSASELLGIGEGLMSAGFRDSRPLRLFGYRFYTLQYILLQAYAHSVLGAVCLEMRRMLTCLRCV